MNTAIETLAAAKLAQLKRQYVTLQQHMALRAEHNAAASESINRIMRRVAMKQAMAEAA